MALPLYLPGLYQFYPIGNSPPVSLTRDLPPDVSANILLLPCGDPRNILYTVFCEKPNTLRKKLDFTCCDYDPGVLARNILLLTMIMDRIAEPTMWNVFFHFYLDIDSRSTLVAQSQKLASYASLEAWRESLYATIIRIGTDHTFSELRRYWELYVDFYHPSKLHRLETLRTKLDDGSREYTATAPKDNIFAIRSAGTLLLHSQASSLFSEEQRRYWETGTSFTDKTRLAASTHPNSTFLYSRGGEGFYVSPNTNPIIPFHHDPFFGNAGDRTLTLAGLVDFAHSQFRAWCSAFQNITTAATRKAPGTFITTRFILGDALAVASALRDFPKNPTIASGIARRHPLAASTVAPWTACPMELNLEEYTNFGAPARFDVIDTSNVFDYLGLLNLFVAVAPLLSRSPSSVLYTETFTLISSSPSIEFDATLFASLSVIAVLMDLAPVDVLSGFTTECDTHELAITYLRSKNKDVFHRRFTWKRPCSGDPSAYPDGGPCPHVLFETDQLGRLLHNVYRDMFRIEDSTLTPILRRAVASSGSNDAVERALVQGIFVHPSREAFVAFLSFVRASLQISEEQWSDVIRSFLDIRSETKPDFDKLRDSDLHAQLYRYGLYTIPKLDSPSSTSTTVVPGRLSYWPNIPPLIRVFFTVPRANFAKLEDALVAANRTPNVWLHCVIDFGLEEDPHFFQSLNAAYGTLVDTGTAGQPDLSFQEDCDGHSNGADLIFSFVVPSHILADRQAGSIAIIRLLVRGEPNTVPSLIPILGIPLCVFSAHLEDTDCVHLLPEQPLPLLSLPDPPVRVEPDEMVSARYQPSVRVELDNAARKVASLTAKIEITDVTAKTAFAGGAMPSVSQCSPCTVEVVLGGRTQTIAFPVPIVGSQRKLRLARKSSYIEVVVPVAIPFLEPDGLKVSRFPVVGVNGSLVPWNVHRVFLDQLPTLDKTNFSMEELDMWYAPHLSWQHSLRERTLRASKDPAHAHSDALVNLKKTILDIMMHAAAPDSHIRGPSRRVYGLRHSVRQHTDTFLFVDKLRFDVAASTFVCDAFVLAVSLEVLPHISHAVQSLVTQGIMSLPVHAGRGSQDPHSEMRAWKALLPALVERCRMTWAHGADCEYRVVQPDGSVRWRVPRELPAVPGDQGDPLCSCGRGKGVEGTGMVKDRVWRKFAPYVTRIALSPLFGVSHVEQILESQDMYPNQKQRPVDTGPASAPNLAVYPVGSNGIHAGRNSALEGSKDLKLAETLRRALSSESPACTIQVVLGGRTQTLAYPMPIVGSRRKLRRALVPVTILFPEPDGLKLNPLPVLHANGSLVSWNVRSIFLDQLPTLDRRNVSTTHLADWNHPHLSWQLSHRECAVWVSADPAHSHSDALVNVKQTIKTIMLYIASLGMEGVPPRVFALQHSVRKDTDTFPIVDKPHHDIVAHAIVCAAFVPSASLEILPHGDPAPHLAGDAVPRRATPVGSVHWRIPRELPAVPGDRGDPLCSCGRGKDVEGTGMVKDRVWRKFAPYVTRIALSPLFGVGLGCHQNF
ncbi:hypothetical protein GSI_10207 [Ganoderma sinense ZZ0214-1]|uniref:DUF4470 domain-containing protein n=1 Tax=Ganoderma sinense ZZ0214-1 TaxID=1077348 RepID=A0A2G8S0J1_9APHY|nr:hypothetical protein GSI_10207 [Ganoderma sinense ZZ0214-1]